MSVKAVFYGMRDKRESRARPERYFLTPEILKQIVVFGRHKNPETDILRGVLILAYDGKCGSSAIVAGAGIGGLAAAAALAPRFDRVVIIEKDQRLDGVRRGAAQGAHIHTLLHGGEMGLERLMPGLRDAFLHAGAVKIDVGKNFGIYDFNSWRVSRPLGLTVLQMSRPAYEVVMRERVLEFANVSIQTGTSVTGLSIEQGCVRGVLINGEQEMTADLVVDARGRGGSLPRDLLNNGFGEAPESVLGIAMSYVTGRFKKPPQAGAEAKAIMVRPTSPDRRYGLVSPIENDEWIVTLGGRGVVEPPSDLEGFFDYARMLAAPEFYEMVEGAELIGDLHSYKIPTTNWRHYDQMPAFPQRLAPLGDTIASVNPSHGQGMSVAVFHALGLADALDKNGLDGDFCKDYFDAAMNASGAAWALASFDDLEFPEVTGERPQNFEQIAAFSRGLKLLGNDDPEIHRLSVEVAHMLRRPDLLQDEKIIGRVMQKLFEAQSAA
jgi:flavin-dependent dehydrogenase